MTDIIIISKSDFEYLVENILDKKIIENIKNSSEQKFTSFYLSIDKHTCEKILDCLTNILAHTGLKNDDEPNDLGLYIEGLIDKFSKGYNDIGTPTTA